MFWQCQKRQNPHLQFIFSEPTNAVISSNLSDTISPTVGNSVNKFTKLLRTYASTEIYFAKPIFTPTFTYRRHYQNYQKPTCGTFSKYDPVKQYYELALRKNPSRTLIVPRELLILADDVLLPSNNPDKSFSNKSLSFLKLN